MRRLAVGLFAVALVLALVLADRLALRSIGGPPSEPDEAGFFEQNALGRVLALREPFPDVGSESPQLKNRPYSWQLLVCQVLSGKFAGRLVLCNQLVSPRPDWNIVVRRGDYVELELAARGRVVTSASLRKPALRFRWLLGLVGAVLLALVALGGRDSARNTLGLLAVVGVVVLVLFPALAAGVEPLLAMAGFSVVVVGLTLWVFYGFDRKAQAALMGTFGALGCVAAIAAALSHGLKLTGIQTAGSLYLAELWQHGGVAFDYRSLLHAGLLAAVLGVAMDTSVSIAAGIEELYRADPGIERKRAFVSGLVIGRDVMGVCATTFVFASVGLRLPILLAPAATGLSPAELVNTEAGCLEIVRVVACGLGLLAAAPLAALSSVVVFSRWGVGPERQGASRGLRWWLAAEVAAIAALAAAIAAFPPHPKAQPPTYRSMAAGSFEAVADEANAFLADYRYPEAILLLWRARDHGIASLKVSLTLPKLYLDYLNYVRYYERAGLPAEVQRRWARSTTAEASRGWLVQAEAELRQALRLDPRSPDANFSLGRVLCQLGRAAEAIPCFEKALEARPDDVELLCDLAAAYTTTGQTAQAEAIARRLETLAPDHPRVKQLRESLGLRH